MSLAHASPFAVPVRVYYEDTDAAGVVYYANYLRFIERARTEWLEAIGFPLAELERREGVVFAVRRIEVDYRAPARLQDRLDATFELLALQRASLVARQEIRRAGETLVTARVEVACLDAARWRPTRIPGSLVSRIAPAAVAG